MTIAAYQVRNQLICQGHSPAAADAAISAGRAWLVRNAAGELRQWRCVRPGVWAA